MVETGCPRSQIIVNVINAFFVAWQESIDEFNHYTQWQCANENTQNSHEQLQSMCIIMCRP